MTSNTRTRIAAIIIEKGKILFLKGKRYEELWTPGGKVDGEETDEECLKRELIEEIGVEITNSKFFKEYKTVSFYNPNLNLTERFYTVTIRGEIKPAHEIESFVWFSKDDYFSKKYPMITHTEDDLIPDLIKDKVW